MKTRLTFLALTVALSSYAATINWTNTAGGNWNAAANWNPNAVPGTLDTAVITNDGTYSVTANVSPNISGLLLGGASGTQTLAMASGTLTISTNGFIGPHGVLSLYSATGKSFYGALTNAGTITWADTGAISLYGTVYNAAPGIFDAQANATMNYFSGTPVFINDGTFRKSVGTGNTEVQSPFVNNGTVEAQTGTIRFTDQPKTLNLGCRFIGAGTNLHASGTLMLAGAFTSSNLVSSGGTLAGNGTVSGTMGWGASTLAAGASLTVATDGQVTMNGAAARTISGTLTNAGLVSWQDAGAITLYGVIQNLLGARFEVRNDKAMNYFTGTPVFINDGAFCKVAGTGNTDLEPPFINNGTVEAQTGTIRFTTQPKTVNAGCRFIGAGTNLHVNSTLNLAGAFMSSNLVSSGGTMAGDGTVSGTMQWGASTLAAGASLTVAADGQVTMNGASARTISGALTNAGLVIWQDAGTISLYGVIRNLVGARFEARNDKVMNYYTGVPVFINDGTFRKAVGTGFTDIEPPFVNYGTVEAQTGTIRFLGQTKTFNDGCRFTGAGTNLLSSGTSTLAGKVGSENLTLNGATLAGTGTVDGSFLWYAGTLSSSVSFNVSPGSLLLLASAGTKTLNGSITNAGTVRWTGSGSIALYGVIHNLAAGLFDVQNNEPINFYSGSPVIINDGTFRKSAGTGNTDLEPQFINNGTVDAQIGSARFLVQPKTFNDGCRFTGAGTNLLSSGTVTLAGAITSENLTLNGSTVTGSGSITGSFFWYSGTLTSDVSFNVPTNGLVLLASSGSKTLNGTITNAGTVRWTGTGDLAVRGTIHNRPGGLFDAANNEPINFYTGTPVFINEGTFRKSVGTNFTTCEIPLTNPGRIEVNSGTLNQTAAFTDQAGTIALGGGTFQTAHALALSGGQLTGAGTVKPGSGAAAGLTSAATVAPAANGLLTIQGDYAQLLPGTLQFTLAGTAPGTNHSQLRITGDATLNGTIGVTLADGYFPNPGDAFNVMTFKNRSGDFACFNGFLFLGQNRRLLTQYSATNLALVTVNLPDPTNPPVRVTAQYPTAVVCWPAEFVGYGLACSTNLSATNWTVVPGVTNRYVETPMTPEKFFRLWKP